MKVVILAGGYGTRIKEETYAIPKPLIKIGEYPIIWHIMKIYSYYGYNDFVIPLGYKGNLIKDFFLNYKKLYSNLNIDLDKDKITIISPIKEKWNINLIDTGLNTMTGGRIKKIKKYLNNERFFLTYGDGLANININKLLNFHIKNKKIATVTAINKISNYGVIKIKKNLVDSFKEKPMNQKEFINGGFFVCEPEIFRYLKGNNTIFEKEPLEKLTKNKQLSSFIHKGFWHSMDNLNDKENLENIWSTNASWKIWE